MNNFNKYQRISEEEMNKLLKKYLGISVETKEVKEKLKKEQEQTMQPAKSIDILLDEYNDYMALYKMFGDREYKDKANNIMQELKAR